MPISKLVSFLHPLTNYTQNTKYATLLALTYFILTVLFYSFIIVFYLTVVWQNCETLWSAIFLLHLLNKGIEVKEGKMLRPIFRIHLCALPHLVSFSQNR